MKGNHKLMFLSLSPFPSVFSFFKRERSVIPVLREENDSRVGGQVRSRRAARPEGQLVPSPGALCPQNGKHFWLARPVCSGWGWQEVRPWGYRGAGSYLSIIGKIGFVLRGPDTQPERPKTGCHTPSTCQPGDRC